VTLCTDGNVSVLHGAGQPERDGQRTFALGELCMAKVDQLVRLHEKLGHMGFDRMVQLIKGGQTLDLGKLHASAREIHLARERVQQCKAALRARALAPPSVIAAWTRARRRVRRCTWTRST
jgi:hypothetical protein